MPYPCYSHCTPTTSTTSWHSSSPTTHLETKPVSPGPHPRHWSHVKSSNGPQACPRSSGTYLNYCSWTWTCSHHWGTCWAWRGAIIWTDNGHPQRWALGPWWRTGYACQNGWGQGSLAIFSCWSKVLPGLARLGTHISQRIEHTAQSGHLGDHWAAAWSEYCWVKVGI